MICGVFSSNYRSLNRSLWPSPLPRNEVFWNGNIPRFQVAAGETPMPWEPKAWNSAGPPGFRNIDKRAYPTPAPPRRRRIFRLRKLFTSITRVDFRACMTRVERMAASRGAVTSHARRGRAKHRESAKLLRGVAPVLPGARQNPQVHRKRSHNT